MDKFKFILKEELIINNHSIIYLANYNNNIVAIKKINKINMDNDNIKLLYNEIKVMVFIKNNPNINIIKCYDIIYDSENNNIIYFILEYCDNTLDKIIYKNKNCENDIKYYFKQIVNGLSYLHKNNIIHRDIKPKNILIKNNIIKICDFGFSLLTNNNNDNNIICGSPLYMAPEMLRNDIIDYKSDIWSIGIVLFEFLFNHNPFDHILDLNELINNDEIIYDENNYSDDCIDFLKCLLKINIIERINLNDIMNHKWIKYNNNDSDSKNNNSSDIDFFILDI